MSKHKSDAERNNRSCFKYIFWKVVIYVGDLVLRDDQTGESRTFSASTVGYAQAEQWRRDHESQGHVISDDNSGSLGRLEYLYPNRNY